MSTLMDEEIKRWTAKRKTALVLERHLHLRPDLSRLRWVNTVSTSGLST
ncbi:hypothetical protein [Roseateles sp. MS654]